MVNLTILNGVEWSVKFATPAPKSLFELGNILSHRQASYGRALTARLGKNVRG